MRVRKIEPEADLPAIKNEAAAERPPQVTEKPTPAKKREDRTAAAPGPRSRRNRGKTTQMDLGFDETALVAPELVPERPLAPAEPIILTLYLRPRHGPAFVGPSIVRNANVVGLRHGNLQIFHHFGAGDLRTDEPLFSLANMFEPGNFDLQRIEAFQTAGLVMFLNLPAALDGPVSFELFLNTAQRLAEGLHGELLTDPQTPLDSTAIEQMRRAAAAFVRHAS